MHGGCGRPWLSCRQPKSLREVSARSPCALALAGASGLWRSKFLAFVSSVQVSARSRCISARSRCIGALFLAFVPSVQVSARSRCIGALDIQIPGFHAVSPSPCASAQAGASGLLAVQGFHAVSPSLCVGVLVGGYVASVPPVPFSSRTLKNETRNEKLRLVPTTAACRLTAPRTTTITRRPSNLQTTGGSAGAATGFRQRTRRQVLRWLCRPLHGRAADRS